jgi:type I restriction enzyme S subunit
VTAYLPLKRVAHLAYGDALSSEDREDGGAYPVVGSGGVVDTHDARNFRAPGIVIGRKGSSGSLHWIANGGFAIDTAYYIDETCTSADLRWLYYALQAVDLKGISQDVGVPGLARENAHKVPIPVTPCLDEQRRIADFLDAETGRIGRTSALTARQADLLNARMLEAMRVATTTEAGNGRPTGVEWMPRINASWQLHKIAHHFRAGSGTTPPSSRAEYYDGQQPWVNSADINDGEIVSTDRTVSRLALSELPALEVHPAGALIVALYGQGKTKGRVATLGIDACLNQACCALIPIGEVSSEYALYWFRAHKEGVVGLAVGAGQPNLSQASIRQLRIPAPDIAEQDRIAKRLQRAEEEVHSKLALLERRQRLLAERRQALITAAVTGEFDVATARGRGTGV